MDNPKVSVIMPVYNAEEYVRSAIESILNQSFTNFELLIVIDDGSKDSSRIIIESYSDSRIKLLDNKENCGLVKVRNRGINEANGEYIAWLDADDLSHPLRLEKQVKVLDNKPDIGICGTWLKTIGTKKSHKWRHPTNPNFAHSLMLFNNPVATSSVMLRKELLIEHNQYFNLNYAEDYDLWERLSFYCKITNIPKILTYYRLHENQTSKLNELSLKSSAWSIYERQIKRLGIIYSDDEKLIHQKLGAWAFDESIDFLTLTNKWLLKLQSANSEKQIYPEPEFSCVLAERWFFACRAVSKLGLTTFLMYWSSPLRKYCEFYKYIYLFGKCLVKR
ncbi:glycosyltransferase family 2 protein [Methanolobus mangrovi]|uniref:Glycosyltransferase family 2 protein n=1 Tax=Methanolobus mangrovi TaxID=3072977 RepID=A0AA51YJ44_9EURY|nr:glycosyltransferase family 2 protein [Methanolobus mangrovi]WMW22220.1 glycosyltransferase family 2 protein [Methanolobus mangrovi]